MKNLFFIYSEDVTLSPGYLKGWRILKMIVVFLGPKILSELVFRQVRIVNAVVALIANRSDPLTEICFTPN